MLTLYQTILLRYLPFTNHVSSEAALVAERRSCGFRRRLREELGPRKRSPSRRSISGVSLNISWTKTTTTTVVQQIFKTSSEINRVCTKLVWYGTESGCCGEIFMSMILRKCWELFHIGQHDNRSLQTHLLRVPSD